MTDEKNPTDRAVELLLFAPLGLALSARDLLPQLVERGRQQVTGQVAMARMIGQFAVKQGTAEAEKALARARTQAQTALEQLGVLDGAPPAPTSRPASTSAVPAPAAPPAPSPSPAAARSEVPRPVVLRDERTAPTPPVPTRPAPTRPAPVDAGSVAPSLAIPDYDSLSASQVLPRLSALDPAELEAVRSHEASHRGRKTILSKVTQLQGS